MDVLLVDDDDDIREEAKLAFDEFKAKGAQTKCGRRQFGKIGLFKNKAELEAHLNKILSGKIKQQPFLIVSDLRMENSQAGIELCKQVRSSLTLRHIPFVIISVGDNVGDINKSFTEGANMYVWKGEDPKVFNVAIRELFKAFSGLTHVPHQAVTA